jgi:hypothetical protein
LVASLLPPKGTAHPGLRPGHCVFHWEGKTLRMVGLEPTTSAAIDIRGLPHRLLTRPHRLSRPLLLPPSYILVCACTGGASVWASPCTSGILDRQLVALHQWRHPRRRSSRSIPRPGRVRLQALPGASTGCGFPSAPRAGFLSPSRTSWSFRPEIDGLMAAILIAPLQEGGN